MKSKLAMAALAAPFLLGAMTTDVAAKGMPSKAEMWEMLQRQQQEIEALKSRLASTQKTVEDSQQEIASNRDGVAKNQEDLQGVSAPVGGEGLKIADRLSISGSVQMQATHTDTYAGVDSSDIAVSEAVLAFDAKLNDWATANVTLKYEDDSTGASTAINVDEARIYIGDTEEFPVYFKTGLYAVNFGSYETNMISDPITKTLGETNEGTVEVGFSYRGLSGSMYAFNGDVEKTGTHDTIQQGGLNIGYEYSNDRMSASAGVGYITSIEDSGGISGIVGAAIVDRIGGITANAGISVGPVSLLAEYTAATSSFQTTELMWNTKGARPTAFNVEAAYGFNIFGKDTTIAASYQDTDEALALGLPEQRYQAAVAVDVLENLNMALEFQHDEDYASGDTGGGVAAATALEASF